MSIYEALVRYGEKEIYPMHMPGHKRRDTFSMCNPYAIDVTEVEGTDNLHHPEGIIRELMNQMREIYHTRESYVLVNGSTCGILTAISACCHRGDVIIMDRNCHRSVYHAVYLLDLKPVYLYRKQDRETGIALELEAGQIREALERNSASCVVVTSPTYEGIVSDIRAIAGEVHRKEIPLIVDEAHGAHFAWEERMPEAAMELGADIVVESLHKTLPAFTQTGVLHVCSERVKKELVERYLDIYETSSPSYILLAGVGQCIDWMLRNGREAFTKYWEHLEEFEERAKRWKTLKLWRNPAKEPSKLVIRTEEKTLDGHELAEILRNQYAVEIEMATSGYILAMTSVCDSQEGFWRLADALEKLDKEQGKCNPMKKSSSEKMFSGENDNSGCGSASFPVRMGIYDAMNFPYREIPVQESVGEISAEYVFFYPPGIPFLVPGEEITESAALRIVAAGEGKRRLFGLTDKEGKKICVADIRKGE